MASAHERQGTQPTNNQDPRRRLSRKQRAARWGAPIAVAATLAAGAAGFAKKASANTDSSRGTPTVLLHKSNSERSTNTSHETEGSFTALRRFMHELNDGKIPVRSLGAFVTFSNADEIKDSYHGPRILYGPQAWNNISWGHKEMNFIGFGMGIAKFEGHTYLFGCDATARMQDNGFYDTPDEAMMGCAEPDAGPRSETIFLDLQNLPRDTKVLYSPGTTYDGKVHKAKIVEKTFGDNYYGKHGGKTFVTPGMPSSFMINDYENPATLQAMAKQYKSMPVSALHHLL